MEERMNEWISYQGRSSHPSLKSTKPEDNKLFCYPDTYEFHFWVYLKCFFLSLVPSPYLAVSLVAGWNPACRMNFHSSTSSAAWLTLWITSWLCIPTPPLLCSTLSSDLWPLIPLRTVQIGFWVLKCGATPWMCHGVCGFFPIETLFTGEPLGCS